MSAAITLALRFWKPLAALVLAALLVWAYIHWRDVQRGIGATAERAEWETLMARQKREAQGLLDLETARVAALEKEKREAQDAQNVKDSNNAKTIADLSGKLRDVGRLRDPNATPARCGGGGSSTAGEAAASAGPGASDGAEAGGLLSAQLTGLLQRLTHEADELNNAYISCRADAFNVRK